MNCEVRDVNVFGINHKIYFISWMDNKPVHFISTFRSKCSEVLRAVKEGVKYIGHQMIKIPTVAMLYNQCMGGTDQFDQMLSYYKTTIKTKRWQTRIFTHFLMCAVVNASILFRLDNDLEKSDPGGDLLSFINLLIDQLATSREERLEALGAEDTRQKRYVGVHCPSICKGTKDFYTLRRVCKECKKRVNTYCKTCDVPLCFHDALGDYVCCFEKYHTRP